ncbi:MAG: DUF692 domain-containing protein [Bdellovibrionales bacterium]|nr:DUF692 domain-containing protein [Bdellovibrionales bacterium]
METSKLLTPVGVGLRPDHTALFVGENPPASVSWVEVITENFLPWKNGVRGKSGATLEKVRARYDVALHGVSLNLGSAEALDADYLRVWKELVDRIEPVRVSDHLCWTGVAGRSSHDLLPLPYTQESLDVVCEKIDRVQEFLGRRFTVENVSAYVAWDDSRMSEAEFLASVAKRTGCGLLLDLNNVFVTARNLGTDAEAFLSALPLGAVDQIHLAGPSERDDGFLVDTHDSDVREEVWALYRRWLALRTRPTAVMVERDGNIPEWEVLEKEILRISAEEGGVDVAS